MLFKAVKLVVLTTVVLGTAGYLLFGTNLGSYLGTVATSVQDKVNESIPVDFEIKRAEGLIQKIDPQIESCKRDVARAEVELEELQGSVVGLEKVTINEEKKLKSGARILSGDGDAQIVLASDALTRRKVELDLQRTIDSFRNNHSILKTKRALIDRQTESVSVAKQRLLAVRAERENLTDQVRMLKTQQQWVSAMAANQQRFDLDDSALSQARAALTQVQKRLDVAQKMLENDMASQGEDPLAKTAPSRNVLFEIQEQFAVNQPMTTPSVASDACTAGAFASAVAR
ncbi:hypothetical protein LBMAG49_12660 [Planctomycetota bacterium]|nr:hypothetical protein LBMAG49_12660 [Planctomycetota bacterium]